MTQLKQKKFLWSCSDLNSFCFKTIILSRSISNPNSSHSMRNIVLIFFLIQFNWLFPQRSTVDRTVVATVDSEPIMRQEMELCEHKFKAEVLLDYKNKFDLQYDDHFWNNSRYGETPAKVLRIKAMNEAIDIKIQQLLAKKLGLITDISYKAFLNDLNTENLRRKEALVQHKVIFGPVQYTEENYFNYRFSNLVLTLKHELAKRVFHVTDEKLHTCYENTKDSLYKLPELIKVMRLELIYINKQDSMNPTKIREKDILIKEIQDRLLNGSFYSREFNLSGKENWLLKSEMLLFDPLVYQNREGEERAEVLRQIEKVETGKFSPVLEIPGSYKFYQVLERKKSGYVPYETVRNSVENQFVNSKYTETVSDIRQKSIIVQF
jgi:hypothetical protein